MPGHLQPAQRLLGTLLAIMALSLSVLPALASPEFHDSDSAASSSQAAKGDRIATSTDDHGRKVYVNAGSPAKPDAPAVARPRRHSVLVYWSNTEHRWKPVPAPPPSVLRAARSAAAEVNTYVASQPVILGPSAAASNPNYAGLARGRKITAEEIDALIAQAAQKHGVDANLVRAVIKVESNFNSNAVSRKGAMGLMQLMPATARREGVSNPFDPQQNVDAGVRHLKHLLSDFHGDVPLSLAAYNAGAGAVTRNKGVPPYRETQDYVKRITELYWNGGGSISGPASAPVHVYRGKDGVIRMTNTE
ncbi:MAG: lytic transglycosylase domain-containing protein [Terriglobales bacterium]